MGRHKYALLLGMILFAGCASVRMPEIPEYHPANPRASEATRAPWLDILNVNPAATPELPVPEGEHHAPEMDADMEMNHGEMPMAGKQEEAPPPPSPAHPEPHHGEPRQPASVPEKQLHGVVIQPGMKEGVARPRPFRPHAMTTDETHYHEHEHRYSTRIVHPERGGNNVPVEGQREWTCPAHRAVRAETPGGRCPTCNAILVPVKAGHDD